MGILKLLCKQDTAGGCVFFATLLILACSPVFAEYDVPSYDEGLNRMAVRDYDGAINEFNRAIGFNNRNGLAFFKRAQCFYYLQNFQLAVDDFTGAISCRPGESEYYLWRGATYAKMGDDPHSIRDYVDALRMDPKLLAAANGAPEREDKTGLNSPMFEHHKHAPAKNERSIHNYQEAVRIVNGNLLARFVPGTIFSGIIRPEFPQDEKAAFLRPDGLDDITANPKATYESCRKLLEADARDPVAHFKRGLALQLMGKMQRAMDDYNDAIAQQANNPTFILTRAALHHVNHNDGAAQNDITQAHLINPDVPAKIEW